MEITIKTHDDFRRDHVTITLSGTTAEVKAAGERADENSLVQELSQAYAELSKAGSENDRLIGQIERANSTIDDLRVQSRQFAKSSEDQWYRADKEALRADELQAQVRDLNNRIKGYDRDRYTEKQRADKATARVADLEVQLARSIDRQNQMEAERADLEAEHRQSIESRDRLLKAANARIDTARIALTIPAVKEARDRTVTVQGGILADAIGNALTALES